MQKRMYEGNSCLSQQQNFFSTAEFGKVLIATLINTCLSARKSWEEVQWVWDLVTELAKSWRSVDIAAFFFSCGFLFLSFLVFVRLCYEYIQCSPHNSKLFFRTLRNHACFLPCGGSRFRVGSNCAGMSSKCQTIWRDCIACGNRCRRARKQSCFGNNNGYLFLL